MIKLVVLVTLLLFTSSAEAANRYIRAAGGNYNAAGTWEETEGGGESVAVPTASDVVIGVAGSGQLTITAAAVAGSVDMSAYANTLTHNGFNWTVSGNITFGAGMTYTPLATATVTLAANNTLTTAGKLFPLMVLNTGITTTLGDNLDFMASKVITLTLNGDSLALNGKTVAGNSATNRVLIRSNTLGTARTITNTTGTFANADFRDITFSTAADYSAITGLSGDCGGNSGATLTTGATQTATGSSANWSVASWSGRVPLPQDDVVLSLTAGQTLTNDMPRMGKSISVTTAMNLSVNTIAQTLYGSLDLTNVNTFTTGTTGSFTFEGRGVFTLTSAGKSFSVGANLNTTFQMVGGTMTLQDAFTSTGSISVSNGTFNTGGFNISVFTFGSSGTATRAINTGGGTITVTRSSAGVAMTFVSTGLTADFTGSTLLISDTGASAKTFAGGGLTYNDLKLAGGGAGAIIITGANTFNRIYTNGGGTKSITLPGSTTTLIDGSDLNNDSNLITFTAASGTATVAQSSGQLHWNKVSLTNIASSGSAGHVATHSIDGGGNTGWLFQSNQPIIVVS